METVVRGGALGALLCMLAACGGSNSGDSSSSTSSTSSISSNSSSSSSTSVTSSAAPLVALTASSYTASPASSAVVAVYRSGNTAGATTVSYTTLNGSAVAGADYTATSGSVSWAAGESGAKSISVPVTTKAAGKQFGVALTSVEGQASFGSPAAATVAVAGVSGVGSSSGATTSASGSMIPSATQLVDSAGNVWTVAGGVVYKGGATAGYSANVALLLYYGGTIYQENKTCLWYSWTGSTWLATTNPAPSLTPACGSTVSSAPPPTGDFGIQVKGNQFVSSKDGSPVQIVGVVISGLETGFTSRWPQYANASTSFWASLINYQGSGLNTIRLPLNEASWLNYTCYDSGNGAASRLYAPAAGGGYTPDPDGVYQATVKQAVANATAAGMYVILDLHWGAPNNAAGHAICPIGQPGFADNDHALAFWKSVADTFKGNPAVIFELFNEPYGTNVYNDWLIQTGPGTYIPGSDGNSLLNGGAYSPFDMQNNTNGNSMVTVNQSWQVAGMQDMLNTIRGEGATNVVLSAPIGWAGEIETWLATKPTDPIGQLGVSWHIYGYNKGTAPPLAVLAAGFPIAITETYGFSSALNGGSNANGYTWAAAHDIGYTWCCWNDWGMQSSFAVAFAEEGPPWFLSTAP
jgi:endoglucanase